MSTYESPYTAENPASFYHYSLHPDDLATRRSISVYSLKDPDKKKKNSRFPQCRVCFATMLLVSLGVAIAVAVTLAIMLSDPHPKFYRTKGTDNTTLSKDFLKEKEADFGNDICDLMSAMFDLRDSSDQTRKVTDCSVILTDSPGNMVINVKLNVDETFIKSDADKIKSMLVANAFTLSSNSSVKKLMIAVPSNKTDIPTEMQSDSSIDPSSSVEMKTSSIPNIDARSSLDMETSVRETIDASESLGIEPSSTHEEDASTSVSIEDFTMPTASYITSPSTTQDMSPSVSAEVVSSSTISSSKIISSSYSQAILVPDTVSVGIDGVSSDSSISVTPDTFSSITLSNTISKTSAIVSSVEYPTSVSISDVVPSVSSSPAVLISLDSSLSHLNTELTSSADRLSSSMSLRDGQMSTDKTEFIRSKVTNDFSSYSVLNSVIISDSVSTKPIITATAILQHVIDSTVTSHPVYTTQYKEHISSSMMSSGYGTDKEEITSYAQVSAADVPLITSYTPTDGLSYFPSSVSTYEVRNSGNINRNILKTSIEYGLESTVMATKALYRSPVISSSDVIINIDQPPLASSLSLSSSMDNPPLHSVFSTQNIPSSYVASSMLSDVTPNVTLKTQAIESGTQTVSDNLIQTKLSTTSVLYPSVVIHTPDMTSLQPDNPSQSVTATATETVPESPPMLRWLDTTMFASENVMDTNSSSVVEMPLMNETNDNETLDKPSSHVTVPVLRKNVTLETSPSPVSVPELSNNTDVINDNITHVTVPLLKPEVKLPVVGTTQTPTSTTQDVGRAIFESEISNRAMGTANPEDFWDNILKMVQYTSTKKPNMGVTSTWKNISSDSNISSVVDETITSSYEPVTSSSLLLTGKAALSTDTLSMSSVYIATSITEINDSISSSVIHLKSADSVVYDSTPSTSLLSSDVYPSPTASSLIRATPVLTAEPGLKSSIEHSAITDTPVVTDSTATVYRLMTASIGNGNDLMSSDGRRNASVKLTNDTKHGKMLLSTTLDASDVSLSFVQDATLDSQVKTSSESSDLVMKTVIVSSAMFAPSSTISAIISSQSSATVTLSDDFAFYDLMPLSIESSSVRGSSGVFSSSIVSSKDISPTSSMLQQQLTDDFDFYDLMPVNTMASSDEISPSKTESAEMKTDIFPTGSLISRENAISSFGTEMQSDSSIYPSSSVEMKTSSIPNIDARSSLDMETSARQTIDASESLGIEPSSTHEEDASTSVSIEDFTMSTVYSSQYESMASSIKLDIAASSSNLQPSANRESLTPVRDVSPSLSTKMLTTEPYSSSLLSSHSFGLEISTSTNEMHSATIDVTPSLETVSNELFIKTSSLNAVQLTSMISSSSTSFEQKSSSNIKATTSLSDVTASAATEPPPSEPVVFNPGSEFGDRLFFANDFSKMDFTRNDVATDGKSSLPSSLFNTVPMIPRVTTPNVLSPRVRVPDLFQGETNPFQTAPTTPKPAVTTPKLASPAQKGEETDSLSSGQFLFDLGSLGGGFGSNLGLGNINFN